MTIQQNYFTPQEGSKTVLNTYCNDLFISSQVCISCADTLILQTPFTNALLPTLPEDQALAARHATVFKTENNYDIVSAYLLGMKSISNLMISFLSNMEKIAFNLDNRLSKEKYNQSLRDFRSIIEAIIDSCTNVNPNSETILSSLQEMNTSFEILVTEIQNDYTRMSTAMKEVKSNDVIGELEAKQKALQSEFSKVNREIAKRATTTIAPDIEFGFRFSKEFLEGVTPDAIAGITLRIVGEANQISEFNEKEKALSNQQKSITHQISNLMDTIATDKTEAMTLTLAVSQMGEFKNQIEGILATATSIVSQMTQWRSQLELLSDYDTPPEPHFYSSQVRGGLSFWQSLYKEINRYLNNMTYSKPTLRLVK